MKKLIARIRVLLTAAPTWLAAAGAGVEVVVQEVADELPHGWQDDWLRWGGGVLVVIGVAQRIVRRVTPVPPAQRGLLPTSDEG